MSEQPSQHDPLQRPTNLSILGVTVFVVVVVVAVALTLYAPTG
ncbi:MAG: hypothetical protein ACOY3X_02685 [Pseudomonadota bacterium]